MAEHPDRIFGLVARYEDKDVFVKAVRAVVAAGYRRVETYTPFDIDGMAELLGHWPKVVQWWVFAGGLFGAIGGFGMMYFATVIDYPLNIGGRPFDSWPAYIPITFELMVLFASLSGLAALLLRCRLPQVHHPVFNTPGFERATVDNFFLAVMADDRNFHPELTRLLLEGTGANNVHLVNNDEQ